VTAATIVQIVAWGAKAISFIVDLISKAVEQAQGGAAPSLDDLDKRLAEHQAGDAAERAKRYAADVADAEAKVREVAAREYSADLAAEIKKP